MVKELQIVRKERPVVFCQAGVDMETTCWRAEMSRRANVRFDDQVNKINVPTHKLTTKSYNYPDY